MAFMNNIHLIQCYKLYRVKKPQTKLEAHESSVHIHATARLVTQCNICVRTFHEPVIPCTRTYTHTHERKRGIILLHTYQCFLNRRSESFIRKEVQRTGEYHTCVVPGLQGSNQKRITTHGMWVL